jgi:hypothetical protein
LEAAGETLVEIGHELGISKRQAHLAVAYGRQMRVAGRTDPYIELMEPPVAASRWRTHPQFRKSE